MSASPIRVLFLDPRDHAQLRTCLLQGNAHLFVVTACADVDEALAAVAVRHPDVVVMEMQLGDESGIRTLRMLRSMHCRAPVVLTSRDGDEQTAINALRAGAADYIAKETLTPARLERAILFALERGRIEERLAKHRENVDAEHRALQQRHDDLRASFDTTMRAFATALAGVRAFLTTIVDGHPWEGAQRELLREALSRCDQAKLLVGNLDEPVTT
ncbi:MAG: response regulator transcription factor [Planctomycetes bacterium]|nr:response regulator transcription factor [Planctomycetota bacterium]